MSPEFRTVDNVKSIIQNFISDSADMPIRMSKTRVCHQQFKTRLFFQTRFDTKCFRDCDFSIEYFEMENIDGLRYYVKNEKI